MKNALIQFIPFTVLLFYPTYSEEFELPKTFVLIGFACFSMLHVNWKKLADDSVALFLFMTCLSAAASTYFSIDRHLSIFGNPKCPQGLLVWISYLVLYLVISKVLLEKDESYFSDDNETPAGVQLSRLVVLLSGVVSIYAIFQVIGIDFIVWHDTLTADGYTRPLSFLGHPNFMAHYLAMTLSFTLWRFEKSGILFERLFSAVVAVTSLIAIFLSQSRGMWIATFVSLFVYVTFFTQYKKLVLTTLTAALIGISILIASIFPLRHMAADRIKTVVSLGPARSEYWKGAIRVWKRYPWFGVGTDAFEIGFQHQRTAYYWQVEHAGSPHKAHNDFLNLLATQGLLGALSGVFLFLLAMRRALFSYSPYKAPALCALLAYFIGGISSFTVVAVGVLALTCLVLLRKELL
jgi:hypothetical protein